jgi:lipopolysaccharide exporter
MSASTGGAVARGAVWMLLARAADRVGGIVSIAVTARYLSPADFGTFQMALSVSALVEMFSLLGFEWTMVRHPDPKREHFDTAFTLQLLFSGAATLIILLLAYPFASFYRTPELAPIIMVMSVTPLLWGINNLALVHLRREYRFEEDFWRMCIPRIISLVAGIALAIWLQSYWALIGGFIIAKVASVAIGYVLHPYRPRLSLAVWRELLGVSMWMQLSTVIDNMRLRIADLVIGRALGSHPLAIFKMSNELANLPQAEFVGALNSAVFPKYGRLQHDKVQLRAAYIDILSLTLLVGLPVAAGLAFTAPAAVMLLLGPKWIEVVPVIQIVAFGALAGALGSNTQFVLLTAAKASLNSALSACSLAFLTALLVVMTLKWGTLGAAAGFTLSSIAVLPIHYAVLRRTIGLNVVEIWHRVWRSLVAVVAMAAALSVVSPAMQSISVWDAAWRLTLAAAIGGAAYVAAVLALWRASGQPDGVEHLLIAAARDIWTRVGARILRTRLTPGA